MRYTHLLLTRFNVRESEADSLALNEAWLAKRFELFDNYCFPSIINQTCKDFKWIILLDGKTPEKFRQLEHEYHNKAGLELYFEYLEGYYDYTNLAPVLAKYIPEGVEYVVTSRVDNDDALAPDYIAEVHKNLVFSAEKNFISFNRGIQYFSKQDLSYNVEYATNHFTTLVEPASKPFSTVLCFDHTQADSIGVFHVIDTHRPMWTEVVHGNNVINNYTPAYKYSTNNPRARKELRRFKIKHLAKRIMNYRLVISNYLFGTSANAINALISLLIYPYVIRVLGIEQYGLYAFALLIANTIIQLESVPFNLPFGRDAAAAATTTEKSLVFSKVLTAKLLLIMLSAALFVPLVFCLPQTAPYRALLIVLFLSILGNPFMPNWYYQAIQKTKVIAYIQVSIRVLSIPFIFIFISKPEHLLRYAVIYTACTLLCAAVSFVYLKTKEQLHIYLCSLRSAWQAITRCLPTFFDSVSELLGKQLAGLLVGSVFGMMEMAYYDLANKIIQLVNYGTSGINTALMPHVINHRKANTTGRLLSCEALLVMAIIFGTVLVGKPLIQLLGGAGMQPAYLLTLLLCVATAADFLSDGIITLVLIPNGQLKQIPYGRYLSLGVFLLFCPFVHYFSYIYVIVAILVASMLRFSYFCTLLCKQN